MSKHKDTSWGGVAGWYEEVVSQDDSYQQSVILPNLMRILDLKKGQKVLDIACGSGFFTRQFSNVGASAVGVDLGKELLEIARQQDPAGVYVSGNAENLAGFKNEDFDTVVSVLALQNIRDINAAINEMSRVVKKGGKVVVVLNHPAFRVPKASEWGYDTTKNIQYRRVDKYMSESFFEIDMSPGEKKFKNKKITISFHRPLQVYCKAFFKTGLVLAKLEEWVSHKVSSKGPRKEAEDRARKEFPLFIALELCKIF